MDLESIQRKYPNAGTFKFGDEEALSQRLLKLVRDGKKKAACEPLQSFTSGNEAMPIVGRKDIALNWDDSPALVIETIEVTQAKFCDVDERFALDEGENDSLDGWRRDHQEYFARNGGFDENMMLVCERFRLVEIVGEIR